MKRFLALFLCIVTATAFVCSSAVAAAEEDMADIPYEAVEEPSAEEEISAKSGFDGIAATAQNADDGTIQVPQIKVVTEDGNGATLQKADGYVNASITITDTDGSVLSDSVVFKVRGNTTAMLSVLKKAYTFKFSKKKDVLGMGKGKKWALLANAFDPTLLRNFIANDMAHTLGLAYTSEQKIVELWLDGEYRGCYTLYEPVQEGKDRVDIDIEGNGGKKDFLIEYEAQRVEDDVTYFTVSGLRFISSEPEEPSEEQLDYIQGTMQDIIDTIKTGTRAEIEQKIDVESFAKFYLMNEFLKTYDFDMSSVFFYYKDHVLYAGPAWDYDLSAGNSNADLSSTRAKTASTTDGIFAKSKNIYKYLCVHDWFYQVVTDTYAEYYDYFADIYADGGLMDTLLATYQDVFNRNYASGCWKVSKWWINIQKRPLFTYKANYEYLKNWYRERNIWLSDYFGLTYMNGDVDGSGDVDAVDAAVLMRSVLDLPVYHFDATAADVNHDNEIDIVDVTCIQRYALNIYVPHDIGERLIRKVS